MKKSNNVIMIVLILLVLGLVGYIVYDKTFLVNNTDNNEVTNNNNNNESTGNNNTTNNSQEDIYSLKTTEKYAGCSSATYQVPYFGMDTELPKDTEYIIYTLEIKENNSCVLWNGTDYNAISFANKCTIKDSYIRMFNDDNVYLYFKINSNNTITYQNANVVMKKIDSEFNANYDFCKNNY